MQTRWRAGLAALGLALVGCAARPPVPPAPAAFWLDKEFEYQAALVTTSQQDLFALDPSLVAELGSTKLQKAPVEDRIRYVVDTLASTTDRPFIYNAGLSTVAAETWRTRRGDCLSLTVLAFAMAQELRLPVTMQELLSTVLFDRRGNVDYRVGHVNLYIDRSMTNDGSISTSGRRGVVVDFEPSYGSNRQGLALSARGILARYYNNLGAAYLAKADWPRAYAHFKAAMLSDADFSAAAANLAWLYWNQGFAAAAERVLTQTAATSAQPDASLRALHRLLLVQGRQEEAARYRSLFETRQKQEPYYWIDRGLAQLKEGDSRGAIRSLEFAQTLATGFSELHQYLAIAYLQVGKPDKAQEQLTTLALINGEDPSLPLIGQKIALARKRAAPTHWW